MEPIWNQDGTKMEPRRSATEIRIIIKSKHYIYYD